MIKDRNNLAKSGDRNSTGAQSEKKKLENLPSFVPYNLLTQHSIPDKSIADCVEGMYLLVAFGSSGILKGKQKLGVTFNSDKLL